jgi:dihydrofolate reductase
MRKVIFLMHLSLDGMVAGPGGEIDWIAYTNELEQYAHALHASTDAVIYGRVTYQMMESYFPSLLANSGMENGEEDGDLTHARWLEQATKYVFSRTLKSSEWRNTVFLGDNLAEEIKRLKEQPGKDLWLLGSPTLAQEFIRQGLIDEYWLDFSPVVLGKGQPLFANLSEQLKLKLLGVRTLEGGVVALRYAPES